MGLPHPDLTPEQNLHMLAFVARAAGGEIGALVDRRSVKDLISEHDFPQFQEVESWRTYRSELITTSIMFFVALGFLDDAGASGKGSATPQLLEWQALWSSDPDAAAYMFADYLGRSWLAQALEANPPNSPDEAFATLLNTVQSAESETPNLDGSIDRALDLLHYFGVFDLRQRTDDEASETPDVEAETGDFDDSGSDSAEMEQPSSYFTEDDQPVDTVDTPSAHEEEMLRSDDDLPDTAAYQTLESERDQFEDDLTDDTDHVGVESTPTQPDNNIQSNTGSPHESRFFGGETVGGASDHSMTVLPPKNKTSPTRLRNLLSRVGQTDSAMEDESAASTFNGEKTDAPLPISSADIQETDTLFGGSSNRRSQAPTRLSSLSAYDARDTNQQRSQSRFGDRPATPSQPQIREAGAAFGPERQHPRDKPGRTSVGLRLSDQTSPASSSSVPRNDGGVRSVDRGLRHSQSSSHRRLSESSDTAETSKSVRDRDRRSRKLLNENATHSGPVRISAPQRPKRRRGQRLSAETNHDSATAAEQLANQYGLVVRDGEILMSDHAMERLSQLTDEERDNLEAALAMLKRISKDEPGDED